VERNIENDGTLSSPGTLKKPTSVTEVVTNWNNSILGVLWSPLCGNEGEAAHLTLRRFVFEYPILGPKVRSKSLIPSGNFCF